LAVGPSWRVCIRTLDAIILLDCTYLFLR
jgi:hypothetical protein